MLSAYSDSAHSAAPASHSLNAIELDHAVELYGGDGIVAEVVPISPDVAAKWLRSNKNNRPIRRRHVGFLADEIKAGNWRVNGEAIIIAENEDILNGQHRLLAVIEAGLPISSLVVYGVQPEAFSTIDTGAARTSADALFLHFKDIPVLTVKTIATAAQWCFRMERGYLLIRDRLSNTDAIQYVRNHPSLVQCAETLQAFPKDARPLSLGVGCALYEIFQRKHEGLADKFVKALHTGENVTRTDPEWLLRQAFMKDAQRLTKLPATAKIRMVIKGWNCRRRALSEVSAQMIALRTDDEQRIRIL